MIQKKKETVLYIGLMTVISIGLIAYYGQSISGISQLRQLPDTYGYLLNAAYLSGTDWIHATTLYYGYGYSLWLIPLFWIYDMGIEIIHRALLINAFFIVGIFWTLNWLLRKLFSQVNKWVLVFISAGTCLLPYLMESSLMVWCESLLSFVVLLCAMLAYQALETQKTRYFVSLGFMVSYCFFVHARSVIFLTIFVPFFVIVAFSNKVSRKKMGLFFFMGVFTFIFGYLLKERLISEVYTPDLQKYLLDNTEIVGTTGNLLKGSDLCRKIQNIFTVSFPHFVYSVFCKVFYLFVSTLGLVWVGIGYGFEKIFSEIKQHKKISSNTFLLASFSIVMVVMLLAVSAQLIEYEEVSYYFYGRYYESFMLFSVAIGTACLMSKRKNWGYIGIAILGIFSFALMYNLHQIVPVELHYDTTAVPALSYGLVEREDYYDMLKFYAFIMSIAACVIGLFRCNRVMRVFIPLALLINPLLSNPIIRNSTIESDKIYAYENEVAEYIWANNPDATVYYLNGEDSIYTTVYAGLQGALGTKKLNVIAQRDALMIEPGALIIAPWGNELQEIRADVILLTQSDRYLLYYVKK